MKHGTTITLPPDFPCPNCKSTDLDVKTVESEYKCDTYVCVKAKCKHCYYVYSSIPFRVIEPLDEEIKDNE